MKTPDFNAPEVFPKMKWQKPDFDNLKKEAGEIERIVRQLFCNMEVNPHFRFDSLDDSVNPTFFKEIANCLLDGEFIDLSNDIWEKLENTDSYKNVHPGELGKAIQISAGYSKNYEGILHAIINGLEINSPIILKLGDRFHLVAGNNRLMIARALGETPKVLIGEYLK